MFEHDHTEKLRMREEDAHEVSLGQTEGGRRKKDRTDPDRRAMTLGRLGGRLMVTTDSVTTRQRR